MDTLNGGLGDDTYSFTLGDGNDVINEAVNATSGGAADRISILAPSTGTDPETLLPILTINALNAFDSNTGTQDRRPGDQLHPADRHATQTITVAGHFTGTNAQTGVERINFNGATYAGYAARRRRLPRSAGSIRTTAMPAASTSPPRLANNFIVGEKGVNDVITGGAATT